MMDGEDKIKYLFNFLTKQLENLADEKTKESARSILKKEFPEYESEVDSFLSLIDQKFVSYNWAEKHIDLLNNVMINFAQHNYQEDIELVKNDLFDSLSVSVKCLGETLRDTTVSKDYLQDIFNSIGDYIFVTDENDIITFVNQNTIIFTGKHEEEILGKPVDHFLPIVKMADFYGDIRKLESINTCPVYVAVNKKQFVSSDGVFLGYVKIARNITAEIKYHEKLKKANKDLKIAKELAEESEKLKSAFLANMSHEIRTPLNGILGFTNILSKREYDFNTRKNYLSIVNKCGQDLITIIDDIIDLSKIESNQLTIKTNITHLNNILNELFETHYIIHKHKPIKFIYSPGLEDGNDIVFTDSQRLRQIFNCLISNAFKFTSKGEIVFGYTVKESMLNFFVKDTGMGIDGKFHEKIFKRFEQAEEVYVKQHGGTGLGLTISKSLVELLGGNIWVESELDKGATFFFDIPYIPVNKTMSESELRRNRSYNKAWGDKTILVVEDVVENSLYIKSIFDITSVQLIICTMGEDAISKCMTQKIDLVLMDITLKGMNGFEATKAIKKCHPNMPVIAQTANVLNNEKERCIDSGCSDYLPKPYYANDLLDMVAKYMK